MVCLPETLCCLDTSTNQRLGLTETLYNPKNHYLASRGTPSKRSSGSIVVRAEGSKPLTEEVSRP